MSKKKTEQSDRKMSVQYGRALIQPASIDVKTREVDVVFATETPVERFGWDEDYNEVLSCEESAIRMSRANKGLPVLDCHQSWSVFDQLGRTIKVWVSEQKEVCARIRFSGSLRARELFQDVADGIVTDISVGYRVYKYEREPAAEGERPIYRAVDWEPNEISFAPVPADINSGVRGNKDEHSVEIINRTTNTNTTMTKNKKNAKRSTEAGKTIQWTVEGGPVKKGDIIDTGEVKGTALDDGEDGDEITLSLIENDDAQAAADDAQAAADDAQAAADDAQAAADDAQAAADNAQTAAENEGDDEEGTRRISAIQQMCRAAGLSADYALGLAGTKLSVDQCRKAVLIRLQKTQRNVGGHHNINVGLDAGTKKRNAAQEYILHRVMPGTFKMTEGARHFYGTSLVEMAKELLHESGINTRGLSKLQVADYVFGKRTHSTSDFPLLFEGVLDKMLRAQYEFAPEFWPLIARQTSVADFRAKGLYQVGSQNGMKEVAEGAEIKYTTLTESKQSIQIKSYAEGIKFTRQAFVNDDLNAFAVIPGNFVKDWDEMRGSLIWGLIINNAKMDDGKALFDTAHGNLLTGASSALSETSLAAAKVALTKQKGIDGRIIRVLPKYLIVAPENEITAKKLITSITPAKSADVNVFANAFDVIVEPRLTDPTAWYLAADPNAVDGLYYAYLEGNESLRVNSEEDFNTDTMKYAVRGDFGAAAIDYRGWVKAAGK